MEMKTHGVEKKKSQRLTILSEDEIAELYAVPAFNKTERIHYFLLPEKVILPQGGFLLPVATENQKYIKIEVKKIQSLFRM